MKILHVNVRLQEGGAARIALDLHRQLLDAGHASRFAYGWGEKGGVSSAESEIPYSFQVGQRLQVSANLGIHSLFGFDYVAPIGQGRVRFVEAIGWADVVHLHVVHSYFLPFGWLCRELVRARKPIVWTAHDYWMLTGRCAFIEDCEGWRRSCGCCLTGKNYPPARFDFSKAGFKVKRQLIASLGRRLHVVAPSEFVAQSVKDGLPDIDVEVIPNWLDREFERAISATPCSDEPIYWGTGKLMLVIIANDLSDPTKVDRKLVNSLIEVPHVEVHTIGNHSPFFGPRIVNHGHVLNRKEFVHLVSLADVTIFTSRKDTFGLVMIEALACGTVVLALESLASKEVLGKLNLPVFKTSEEILSVIKTRRVPEAFKNIRMRAHQMKIRERFSSSVGTQRYIKTYDRAVASRVAD